MAETNDNGYGFDTNAVHKGHHTTNEGEQAEPIFTSSSFTFDSAAEAAARFAGEVPGNIYSRFTNPTVRTFEQRLAGSGVWPPLRAWPQYCPPVWDC